MIPRRRSLQRVLLLSGFLLLCVACTGSTDNGAGEISFALRGAEAFANDDPQMAIPAFDLIATDFDLDADPDLLINWHHFGPLELYENRDGTFRVLDRGDGSRSGLIANPSAPGLFRYALDAESAIREHGEPGLYVWHDERRSGAWQFLWSDPADRYRGCVVQLTTSLEIKEVKGLEPAEVSEQDERRRTLRLSAGTAERRFAVTTEPVGVRLEIRVESTPEGKTGSVPALYAGTPPVRQQGSRVELWKPDPHGMAWVDVEGSPHPELFVTRGGLAGQLAPPLAPKTDRFFEASGAEVPYRLAGSRVPRGYGRGRSVEWVDVDNDGRLELYVSNEAGPNALLFFGLDGKLVDRAAELGLALDEAATCWGDVDRDGFQDLLYLAEREVAILLNRGNGVFEAPDSGRFQMALPQVAVREAGELFDRAVIRLADFDADGDLDVWALGRGPERRNHLFLRDGEESFRDVTSSSGFEGIAGNEVSVLGDFDQDRFEDLLVVGAELTLWRNHAGREVRPVVLPFGSTRGIGAAAAADVNRDGRLDVILAGVTRAVLENRTGEPGQSVDVLLRDSAGTTIGATVTAVYEGERRVVRRLGSERTAYSQTAGVLRFARPTDAELIRLDVRWPGASSIVTYEVPPGDRVVLERAPADAASR